MMHTDLLIAVKKSAALCYLNRLCEKILQSKMAAMDDCDGKIMAKVCNNDNSEKLMLSYPIFTRNQHKIFWHLIRTKSYICDWEINLNYTFLIQYTVFSYHLITSCHNNVHSIQIFSKQCMDFNAWIIHEVML